MWNVISVFIHGLPYNHNLKHYLTGYFCTYHLSTPVTHTTSGLHFLLKVHWRLR